MKKWVAIGILLLSLCWPLMVQAEGELDTSYLDFRGADEVLEDAGGDELLKQQTGSRTIGQLLKALLNGESGASWADWAEAFAGSLFGNLKEYLGLMLQVAALALLSQLFNVLDIHFGAGGTGSIGFLAVYGVLVLVLVQSFRIAYEEAQQLVENVRNLSVYMIPAMAAVAAAGGYAISSVMQSELMTGGFSLILTVMKNCFAVGILWVTVLEIVNFISKRALLSQLTSLVRTVLEKGMKAVSALYLFLMGTVGVVMPAADQAVYKASSAVVGSVPVVGSAMSGAMDSVLAGSVLIKNGIGAAGCIALLCICLVPAAKLTAIWLVYRLLAAFLSPVADERVVQVLAALARSTSMLLGVVVSSIIVFTGAVGIFVMSTGR